MSYIDVLWTNIFGTPHLIAFWALKTAEQNQKAQYYNFTEILSEFAKRCNYAIEIIDSTTLYVRLSDGKQTKESVLPYWCQYMSDQIVTDGVLGHTPYSIWTLLHILNDCWGRVDYR